MIMKVIAKFLAYGCCVIGLQLAMIERAFSQTQTAARDVHELNLATNPDVASREVKRSDVEGINLATPQELRATLLSFFKNRIPAHDYADLMMALDGFYSIKFNSKINDLYEHYLIEKKKQGFIGRLISKIKDRINKKIEIKE